MQCNGIGYAWTNEDECSVTEWVTPGLKEMNQCNEMGYAWGNED